MRVSLTWKLCMGGLLSHGVAQPWRGSAMGWLSHGVAGWPGGRRLMGEAAGRVLRGGGGQVRTMDELGLEDVARTFDTDAQAARVTPPQVSTWACF